MFGFDVGNEGHPRLQVQKPPVVLIRFENEKFPASKPGEGTTFLASTDEAGGISAALLQDLEQHARGRRLSVGTGHRNGSERVRQIGYESCPGNGVDPEVPRRGQLRVVPRHRGRVDHEGDGVADGVCTVPGHYRDPVRFEIVQCLRRLPVRSADPAAEMHQQPRQAFHAHTADTDQMDMGS